LFCTEKLYEQCYVLQKRGLDTTWFLAAYFLNRRTPQTESCSAPSASAFLSQEPSRSLRPKTPAGAFYSHLSTYLNDAVDSILQAQGLDANNRLLRYQTLRALACYVITFKNSCSIGRLVTAAGELSPQWVTVACGLAILGLQEPLWSFLGDGHPRVAYARHSLFGCALWAAVQSSQPEIVRGLLTRGEGAKRKPNHALELAVQNNNIHMVKVLLPLFADVKPGTSKNKMFEQLVMQTLTEFRPEMTLVLLEAAKDLELLRVCSDGLRAACLVGDPAVVGAIWSHQNGINVSVNVDRVWPAGRRCKTPLAVAVRAGHEEVVRSLLAKGAFIEGNGNHRDQDNRFRTHSQPMMCVAAFQGHVGVANALLDAGARLNPSEWVKVVFWRTYGPEVLRSNTAFLQMLIDRRYLDLPALLRDLPDKVRNIMRSFARYGHAKALRLFASEGVPIEKEFYPAESGLTLMQVALSAKRGEVVKTLLQLGTSPLELDDEPVEELNSIRPAVGMDQEHALSLQKIHREREERGVEQGRWNENWIHDFLEETRVARMRRNDVTMDVEE
jgi:hypothetical protein